MHALVDGLAQRIEIRPRLVGDLHAPAHQRAEPEQRDAEPVLAAVAVLLQHAFRHQRHRQPMRGALGDAEPLRQRADADVDLVLGERLEQPHRGGDRRQPLAPARLGLAGRFPRHGTALTVGGAQCWNSAHALDKVFRNADRCSNLGAARAVSMSSERTQHEPQDRHCRRRTGWRRRGAGGEAAGRRGRDRAAERRELRALREAAAVEGRAAPARRCREDAPIAGQEGRRRRKVTLQFRARARRSTAPRARWSRSRRPPPLRRAGARDRLAQARAADVPAGHAAASTICAPRRRRWRSRPHLAACKSLVLIGGGVVGLEIAASAAELGIKVTVIEIAPRILARVCDEETSAIILAEHQRPRRRYPHRHVGHAGHAASRTGRSRW